MLNLQQVQIQLAALEDDSISRIHSLLICIPYVPISAQLES